MKKLLLYPTSALLALWVAAPAYAGFNASAPRGVRRIFTQLAFAEGRLVTYHVLEPGPVTIQAFPTASGHGELYRFPGCPNLRPVLDDSAAPSADVNHLIADKAMRRVFNVTLSSCAVQPTSLAQAESLATSIGGRLGDVNAPSVPAPVGAAVPANEQQSATELWGPLPNVGVVDVFAGGGLSPQHTQATTISGLAVANLQQPSVRRPRLKGYAAGKLVYFMTWETRDLADSGLVGSADEAQWRDSGFPGERALYFLAYGRAPLPPNGGIVAGSLDSTGVVNDNQAVLNVVGGAPFWQPGAYSPLWKMNCLDGGITPTIGPGAPCGNTRFHQIGQPRDTSEVGALPFPMVKGIFRDINCPVIGTDVNDDGLFADTELSQEVVRFPDIDWDGDGLADDGLADPDSTLQ